MNSDKAPDSWKRTTLGDVCDVVGGSTPRTTDPENWEGDIPWLTPNDLSGYSGKYIAHGERFITQTGYDSTSTRLMPAGSVLFTSRAPIGYVAIASQPLCTNQGFKSFVPSSELSSEFLYWYLRYATPSIQSMGSGTTFKEISGKVAKTVPIAYPLIDEQRRIVQAIESHLSHLDAGGESLERSKRNVDRMRAAVLSHAVLGRLVPQDTEDDPVEDLEDLSEEVGAFSLPPSWKWSTFQRISPRVTVGHVGPMKHAYVNEGGVPFLRSQNVRENRFDPEGLVFVDPEFESQLTKSRLSPGDILVVRSGNVGITCVVPDFLQTANCADLVIVKKPELVAPEFAAFYMNSVARQLVAAGTTGSALTHFNTKSVAALPVPVPPLLEQKRIVDEVQRQFSILDALQAEISKSQLQSEGLRRSMLQAAFSGRLPIELEGAA